MARWLVQIQGERLDEFSGIIFLLWKAFRKPSIGQVIHEVDTGKRNVCVFVSGIAVVARKLGVFWWTPQGRLMFGPRFSMPPAGFEPTASGLGILRSIRLSYGDV